MNETIKNILLEYIDINKYKKFKNSVYKFLNYELSESELEKDDLVWEDKLKTLPYIMIDDFNITELDAEGIIFEYLLDIGDNPLEYITLDDLRSKYYGNDVVNLLENTGWLDKYIKDEHAFPQTFNDVEKKRG